MAVELTDVAVEAAEHIEEIVEVAKQPNVTLIAASALTIGLAGGFAAGYFYTKRKLDVKYAEFAEEEIAEMRIRYNVAKATEKAREPKPDLEERVVDLGYRPPDDPAMREGEVRQVAAEVAEVVAAETTINVFEEAAKGEEWDYAVEMKRRTVALPYVIHHDEWSQNESEYEQSTLSYYDDDDVLSDERDGVVDNRHELLGDEALMRFGHGSNDPNVVYVRNHDLEMEFEVVRSPGGNYAEEVHGFPRGEMKHEERRMRRRRRFDDE